MIVLVILPFDAIGWPRGYKTFFMLNSTEHEISTAHKNKNTNKKEVSCFKSFKCCIYHANKCLNGRHFNIYKHDKFRAPLS